MNKPTLKALKESIKAWELKYELAKKKRYWDIVVGWRGCPLCQRFLHKDCKGCPIKMAGFEVCEGTAYDYVTAILNSIKEYGAVETDHENLLKFIKYEILFLKSLLPIEEK